MSRKSRGIQAERDLVHLFWSRGWAAMRAAGSGSSSFPSPDLLVGYAGRRLAIESKLTSDTKKYFPKDEIKQLQYFCKQFGAEMWFAVKFPRTPWAFFSLDNLEETEKSYVASLANVELKALSFEELIDG